jgi:hypothetical protein
MLATFLLDSNYTSIRHYYGTGQFTHPFFVQAVGTPIRSIFSCPLRLISAFPRQAHR